MLKKPSYEELERRVVELEKQLRLRAVNATLRKSTELFEKIFRSQPDAVFILDAGIPPKIIDCNPAAESIFGYSRNEMLNETTEILHISQDALRDFQKKLYPKIFGQGLFHLDNFMMKRKDGAIFPSEHSVAALSNEKDERTGWLSVVRDITSRRKAEEALRRSEEDFRSVVEDMPALICRFLPDGTLTFVNSRYCSFFNKKREELTGRNFFQFIPEDEREKVRMHFMSLSAEFPMVTYEHQVIAPDGTVRWQQWTDRAIVDEGGRVREFQSLGIDVTERRAIEDALRESERKYRDLFNNAQVGICRTRISDGRIIDANYCAARMLGYDNLEEFTAEYVFSERYVDAGTREQLISMLREKGEVSNFEARFFRKDDSVMWARYSARAYPEEGCLEAVIVDATEEKQASAKLVDSEKKYRMLIENAGDAIFIVQDQQVKFPNRKAKELESHLGLELDQHPFTHYIHPDDRDLVMDRNQKRMSGDKVPETYTFRLVGKDESVRWVELNAVLIDWEGKPATLNFLRDITLQKEIESRLQQVRRMEALGTLAGGIAHDFNNLLMGIQGRTSLMLLDMKPSDPRFEELKNIEEIVKSGADLTKQLLGFARGGKYEVRPTNLNGLILKTVSMFARTRKEIKVLKRFEKHIWTVEVDRIQIEQVLLNLFLNAWQAMPEGGELYLQTENVILTQTDAELYQGAPGKYVRLSVNDTGIGMDEATQQRVFEPFFSTKGIGRGTGLGLASAYGIIKNHNGIISVNSKEGVGTAFNILLPASNKEPLEESESVEEVVQGAGTILLVDDEEMILAIVEKVLLKLGYKVFIARNGREALRIYDRRKNEIDLVVLDIIMPEMSGGEVYDRLKAMDPNVKVLLSTGYAIEGEASRILETGCEGFIQKPFKIGLLARRIREILENKRSISSCC
jgi:two-component system cell cycle sensor histidine kinase/response regulator CckA